MLLWLVAGGATMAVDEAARQALRRRLDEVLGEEHATTLMAQLPDLGRLATTDDVRALSQRVDHLESSMGQRFDFLQQAMDERFTQVQQSMDERFARMQESMDVRFAKMQESMELRFAAVDQRWDGLEGRLQRRDDDVDRRFAELDRVIDDRVTAAKDAVIGTLRGDIITQTRTMVFTMAGTVAALGGLALALGRLG